MRTVNRRATRDRLTTPNGEHLPDGIGGTITGGPMEPIDLMEILTRSALCVSRGGAVSGAAQVVASGAGERVDMGKRPDRGIALSDGSRITFASLADSGVLREEDGRLSSHNSSRVFAGA
jgi:hypothetical protein